MSTLTPADEFDEFFSAVLRENRDRIYRICSCYVRDPEGRNDVFQETVIHLWQSLPSFRGESAMSTWIYRVTVNTCLSYLRSERRRQGAVDAAVEPDTLAAPEEDSDQERESDLRKLHACISRLPLLARTLITLSLEEATTQEMGEILGISEVNVRVRLHRARTQLKELWGKE